MLVVVAAIAFFGESAPSPGSAHFLEGDYEPTPIGDYVGGTRFHFHGGRFECEDEILRDGLFKEVDFRGAYERHDEPHGEAIILTPDDPAQPPATWHYRNFGGVPILVTDPKIVDVDHQLGTYLVFRRQADEDTLYWLRVLRTHPEFTKALPMGDRDYCDLSWWHYQRARLWWFLRDHSATRWMPEWLKKRMMTGVWNNDSE